MLLRPFVAFYTAEKPDGGDAMKVTVQKGIFRPGRDGAPNYVEFAGTLDGEIENGEMEFQANRCSIARGQIRGAAFQAKTSAEGEFQTALTAEDLFFELSSGNFVVPGGMGVAIDSGSTFDVKSVKVTSDGHFSGVAKLDLAGKTGELTRRGATISASDITLKTPGLTIVDGKATGPVELAFKYQLEYPFVVKYPIEEIPEKKLMLDFHGPFATSLQLKDAGGDDGEVTGTYVFKAPWDPIEQAALAALEAKWQQDLAVKNIDFAIVPRKFRPCGESCFLLEIEVTAEKRSSTNRLEEALLPVLRADRFGEPLRRQAGARLRAEGRQDRDALQRRRRLGRQLPGALSDQDLQRDEALPDAAEPAPHDRLRARRRPARRDRGLHRLGAGRAQAGSPARAAAGGGRAGKARRQ